MAIMNYLDALQVGFSVMIIVGLGFLCGGIKMFGLKEAFSIRRTTYLIAMPGLIFREIARHKLNLHDWQPLFNGLLVQLTTHAIVGLVCFIFPIQNKKRRFLSIMYSITYINFVFFGYPVVQVLFGDDYVYIPALHNLVTLFFCIPLHTYLSFENEKDMDKDSHEYSSEDSLEDGIEKVSGGPIQPVEQANGEGEPVTKIEVNPSTDTENPATRNESSNEEGNNVEPTVKVSEDLEEGYEDPSTSTPASKPSRFSPRFWAVFWSIVTPCNVCAILGIIWSATGWKMPVFLHDFVYDLEKATMAAGLFTCGIFMWEHPLLGCNAWKLILALACHFVLMPLISMFWSWVCKVDSKTSIINVLVHSMPTALIGYVMSTNTGHVMKTASFTFFWSILFSLPFLMLWVIVFNELKIFV